MEFKPTTFCFRSKRLTAKPRKPHGKKITTPSLILKHLESICPQRHPQDIMWHRKATPETI